MAGVFEKAVVLKKSRGFEKPVVFEKRRGFERTGF